VLLHFGAVDYRARVWVNSQFIMTIRWAYPFTVDITPVLNEFGPQRVTVWAADDPMTWLNRVGSRIGVWNRTVCGIRTSGIWQTVWAERVGATYIDRIRWTPIRALGDWFEAFVAGEQHDGIQLKVKLSVGDQLLVNDTYVVLNGDSPA